MICDYFSLVKKFFEVDGKTVEVKKAESRLSRGKFT